jgi:hypothetical protein
VSTKKCPVCDWEIKGKGKEVKLADKTVVVCCDECAAEVKKHPSKYAAAG